MRSGGGVKLRQGGGLQKARHGKRGLLTRTEATQVLSRPAGERVFRVGGIRVMAETVAVVLAAGRDVRPARGRAW